jgi:hypothetical protein
MIAWDGSQFQVKPFEEIENTACVKSIKFTQHEAKDGSPARVEANLQLWPKTEALQLLCKRLDIGHDRVSVEVVGAEKEALIKQKLEDILKKEDTQDVPRETSEDE